MATAASNPFSKKRTVDQITKPSATNFEKFAQPASHQPAQEEEVKTDMAPQVDEDSPMDGDNEPGDVDMQQDKPVKSAAAADIQNIEDDWKRLKIENE